jgi:hypothetical protein
MPRYRVSFFKTVCGDTGNEAAVCQRAVEVEAENAEAALEPARALFCKLEEIRHWSIRSDGCAMQEVEIRAPTSRPKHARLSA